MSIEDNKRLVIEFFSALRAADVERLSRLTTDDLEWWVAPTTLYSGSYAKPQWVLLLRGLFEQMAEPYEAQLLELTAEADRVSATSTGRVVLKSGKVYQNDYHLLFSVRDGKISGCREYMDSYRCGLIFGFPPPGAPDSSLLRQNRG